MRIFYVVIYSILILVPLLLRNILRLVLYVYNSKIVLMLILYSTILFYSIIVWYMMVRINKIFGKGIIEFGTILI